MKYLWNKRIPGGEEDRGTEKARDRGPDLGALARSRELTLIITSSTTRIRGGELRRSRAPSRANTLLVTDARLPRMVALLFSILPRRRRRRRS